MYVYIHILQLIFLSQVIFVFLLFLGMITYANEVAASSTGFLRFSGTTRAGDKHERGLWEWA